jgi:hypothetical protein
MAPEPPSAVALASHFPNADECASLIPVAAVVALPFSSEVASPSLPSATWLIDVPPVSDIASEKLPPLAVALEVPWELTSASAELPASDAFAVAVPVLSELAKQSLPSVPVRETLVFFFSTHFTVNGGCLACAGAAANPKSIAPATPIIKKPCGFIDFPPGKSK